MTATPKVPATDLMSVEAARALTDQIRDDAEMLWAKIVDAYTGRVWQILGYSSWDTYCGTEFGNMRLRLPKEERRDAVCSLRESGLSDRAIESATGISRRTLIRDRRSGGDNVTTSPEMIDAEVVPEPKPITGIDGKTYKPKALKTAREPASAVAAIDLEPEPEPELDQDALDRIDRIVNPPYPDTIGVRLSHMAKSLDELADYVATLDADARLKLLAEHKGAVNDVSKRLRKIAASR